MKKVALVLLVAFLPATVMAHGGGTNSEGCHNDKKRGTYHCH